MFTIVETTRKQFQFSLARRAHTGIAYDSLAHCTPHLHPVSHPPCSRQRTLHLNRDCTKLPTNERKVAWLTDGSQQTAICPKLLCEHNLAVSGFEPAMTIPGPLLQRFLYVQWRSGNR